MRTSLIIFITVVFSGCAVYYPQAVDIPLINKKNDLRIDGGILLPRFSASSTISYGLTNHIAIQLYGNLSPYTYLIDHKAIFNYQGALGYYTNFGNSKIFEIYSGFGRFNTYYVDQAAENPYSYNSNYKIYFAQFNLGKKNIDSDYGLGIKAGLISSTLEEEYSPPHTSINSYNSFLVEPTFFVSSGYGNLRFKIKLGTCLIYNHKNTSGFFPLTIGVSLNYRL